MISKRHFQFELFNSVGRPGRYLSISASKFDNALVKHTAIFSINHAVGELAENACNHDFRRKTNVRQLRDLLRKVIDQRQARRIKNALGAIVDDRHDNRVFETEDIAGLLTLPPSYLFHDHFVTGMVQEKQRG